MFECQAARWQPIAAFRGCRPWPHLEFDRLAMQADRSGAAEHAGEERIVAERSAAAVVGDLGIEGRTVERACAAVLPTQQIDRKSVVEGKSVSVRVDIGGRRLTTTKKNISTQIMHANQNPLT